MILEGGHVKMNKKALSNIVANVLMIILIVVAMGILAANIFEIIKMPALSPENSCIQIQLDKIVKIERACYNQGTGNLEITLERKRSEISVNELKFILDGNSWNCNSNCENCEILSKGKTKTYYFSPNAKEVAIVINGCLIETRDVERC